MHLGNYANSNSCLFSSQHWNLMGYDDIEEPTAVLKEGTEVSLSSKVRWLRCHNKEDIETIETLWKASQDNTKETSSTETIDNKGIEEKIYYNKSLKLYEFLARKMLPSLCRPTDPDKMIGRRKRTIAPKTSYKMNLDALIEYYKTVSFHDLLCITTPPKGLEEEHLEALRASLGEALKKNQGRLCVSSNESRLSGVALDVSSISKPVAVAALVAMKDYLDDKGGKVSLGFVRCQNTDGAENHIKKLAEQIGINPRAFRVIITDSMKEYINKL